MRHLPPPIVLAATIAVASLPGTLAHAQTGAAPASWISMPWSNAVIAQGMADDFPVSVVRIPSPFDARSGWPTDFTEIDEAWGGLDGLQEIIDTAHASGIRVLLDINLNGDSLPARKDSAWTIWWSPAWIRADLPGYLPCGDEPITACTNGLADFRTEIGEPTDIPPVLLEKWGPEKAQAEVGELDQWFARTRYPRTPRHYLIKWMVDWVRELGVDGFFAIDADLVDVGLWATLQSEAAQALTDWRNIHGIPTRGSFDFWITGDVDPVGPTADALRSVGFSALPVQLSPEQFAAGRLDSLYAGRAAPDARQLTAHLEGQQSTLTALMPEFLLLPGPVALPADLPSNSSSSWFGVAEFRSRHPAIGAGIHQLISANPYTFQRTYRSGNVVDNVIAVMGAEGRTRVNVSGAFPDDAIVRDAMTGTTAFVSFGYVSLTPGESGLLLLELAD